MSPILCFVRRPPRLCGPGLPGLAPVTARGPGARPPSHPALTAQRARLDRSRPGPAPPPWEATSLAMETEESYYAVPEWGGRAWLEPVEQTITGRLQHRRRRGVGLSPKGGVRRSKRSRPGRATRQGSGKLRRREKKEQTVGLGSRNGPRIAYTIQGGVDSQETRRRATQARSQLGLAPGAWYCSTSVPRDTPWGPTACAPRSLGY
jgi:hypothetical protein